MSAVGPVATSVNRSTEEATEASYSITRQREAQLTVALLEASTRAETDGWDGYNAEGVKTGSYISAGALLRVLPADVPAPEISVHPDGQIALDWTADRDHVFSISVSDSGVLSYAGLFGGSKVTGREVFSGMFPDAILPHVIRIAALMLLTLDVVSQGLTVRRSEPPERHCDVADWPAEKEERMSIAQELARVARLVLKP